VTADRAMARAQAVGQNAWAAVIETTLARVALTEDHADDALRMARHAEKVLSATEDRINHADAIAVIGAACEALGRTVDADKAYAASIDMYTKIEDYAHRSTIAAEYARVLKSRGQIDEAFEMLELARGGVTRR
jgi:tetratricopeptide (TPR) repeat protein